MGRHQFIQKLVQKGLTSKCTSSDNCVICEKEAYVVVVLTIIIFYIYIYLYDQSICGVVDVTIKKIVPPFLNIVYFAPIHISLSTLFGNTYIYMEIISIPIFDLSMYLYWCCIENTKSFFVLRTGPLKSIKVKCLCYYYYYCLFLIKWQYIISGYDFSRCWIIMCSASSNKFK